MDRLTKSLPLYTLNGGAVWETIPLSKGSFVDVYFDEARMLRSLDRDWRGVRRMVTVRFGDMTHLVFEDDLKQAGVPVPRQKKGYKKKKKSR